MILCDLPYGTTDQRWDKVLDFKKLWEEYERLITDRGAIVLFASGRFAHKLIQSNEHLYRYKWIWVKNTKGNFVNAKNRPMTGYEEILVFSKGVTANGNNLRKNYYPQGVRRVDKTTDHGKVKPGSIIGTRRSHKEVYRQEFTGHPCDVLYFDCDVKKVHTNQKPVPLLEYLVKTYTNEGDTVMDNCMGSGSTGVACVNTGRRFIGIEKDEGFFQIAKSRIQGANKELE